MNRNRETRSDGLQRLDEAVLNAFEEPTASEMSSKTAKLLEIYSSLGEERREAVLTEMRKLVASIPANENDPRYNARVFLESVIGHDSGDSEKELKDMIDEA